MMVLQIKLGDKLKRLGIDTFTLIDSEKTQAIQKTNPS